MCGSDTGLGGFDGGLSHVDLRLSDIDLRLRRCNLLRAGAGRHAIHAGLRLLDGSLGLAKIVLGRAALDTLVRLLRDLHRRFSSLGLALQRLALPDLRVTHRLGQVLAARRVTLALH